MIYLDNAATTYPKPQTVIDAVADTLTKCVGNPGRSGHEASLNAGRTLYACRQALADLFGAANPLDFAFCLNCTDALNQAIRGAVSPGDHVITTCLEHNSVLRPLFGLKNVGVIELTVISPDESGRLRAEDIADALRENTRLVAMQHVSNVTGVVQNVAALTKVARAAGALTLIDGAQAAGCFKVDIAELGCDMYAFPGHKGLYGPMGTGGLYVAPWLNITPLREGGTGSSSDLTTQPMERPERYESGTQNLPGIAGLYAGVTYVSEHLSGIQSTEKALSDRLWSGLCAINGVDVFSPPPSSGYHFGPISFAISGKTSSDVADALSNNFGIALRSGLHCAPLIHKFLGTFESGLTRASVGAFNTQAEIDALLNAVDS